MEGSRMVTIKDLAVDWIQTRSALRQQIRKIETDPAFPETGLPDDERRTIVGHLKSAVAEFDALLKEHPNT
jgi:hypothetical protein